MEDVKSSESEVVVVKSSSSSSSESKMSYRYWVREVKEDAVPLPEPKKVVEQHKSNESSQLGSVWNKAGTWEEKNLNKWGCERLKHLLMSIPPLDLGPPNATARISDLSKCDGDAFLVTVRNKRRVGYTYELSLKVEAHLDNGLSVKAHLDIPEISFGEVDDLEELQVRFSDDKQLSGEDKSGLRKHFNLFLGPIREKLLEFERQLKELY